MADSSADLRSRLRRGLVAVASRRAGIRVALLVAILAGGAEFVGLIGLLPGEEPHPFFGMNFSVYYVAAEAALAGESMYEVPAPGYPGEDYYLYPPILVLPFMPFLVVPRMVAFAAFTVLSLTAGVAAALLVVRYLRKAGVDLERLDVALLVGVFTVSTHAVPTLYFGNVNLLLGAGAVVGFVALESAGVPGKGGWRPADPRLEVVAGFAFGVVALVKAFPALLGLWLLRTRSAVAVGVWGATGALGLLAGVLVFGRELTVTYFRDVLLPRSDTAAFVGGADPAGPFYVSLRRPLSQLVWWVSPEADPVWLTVVTLVVAAAVLAVFYRGMETRNDRLAAMLATAAVAVTAVASYRLYLVLLLFPMLALLFTFEGPGYRAYLAGAVLVSVTVRPGDVLELVSSAPAVVEAVLAPVLTVASLPLIGLGLMLAGCLRAKIAGWESSA
ncbi:hypothetical protein JCM17823_17660 [Halorubrum gandharaense]